MGFSGEEVLAARYSLLATRHSLLFYLRIFFCETRDEKRASCIQHSKYEENGTPSDTFGNDRLQSLRGVTATTQSRFFKGETLDPCLINAGMIHCIDCHPAREWRDPVDHGRLINWIPMEVAT